MIPSATPRAPDPSSAAASSEPTSKDFEDFIYLISHDVRNSVRALIELPQWIAEDLTEAGVKIDGSVAESIELMNKHTGRLDRMLVDLLTFSRVGRMQNVEEVQIDAALSEVLEEIHIPQGFTVLRALDCDVLKIGERDIMTLLTALISNAVKHHDRTIGKIVVACYRDRHEVVLTVRDNGPGIPAGYHERVLGAMTTLRPRDEVEGSGMGLAITRKIALLYEGSVSIKEISEGRGTTIEVRLPA
ncbi:HAMP domain-containing histidine kinase [Roseobacter sp. YSTF-M11]|uniref:histidine kinase n=1 Tax=Roseobacter insulae TaxID=2859783 RepID=A0A9X1FZL8_9RHOB|nr:HAMP domain-containing sensor histidine kinase [Roseobacter insulae]MBW4710616.1 HAMP domain-containing histidine kinase [Roseobacter insulae]